MATGFALLDFEVARVAWAALRADNGRTAAAFPTAIEQLVRSQSDDEAQTAYWQLDSWCVRDRQLFESSVPMVAVLLAGLAESMSSIASSWMADLLVEIVLGEPDQSEIELGASTLGLEARLSAQQGTWLMYDLFQEKETGVRESALTIIYAVDPDRARVAWALDAASADGDPLLKRAARDLNSMSPPLIG